MQDQLKRNTVKVETRMRNCERRARESPNGDKVVPLGKVLPMADPNKNEGIFSPMGRVQVKAHQFRRAWHPKESTMRLDEARKEKVGIGCTLPSQTSDRKEKHLKVIGTPVGYLPWAFRYLSQHSSRIRVFGWPNRVGSLVPPVVTGFTSGVKWWMKCCGRLQVRKQDGSFQRIVLNKQLTLGNDWILGVVCCVLYFLRPEPFDLGIRFGVFYVLSDPSFGTMGTAGDTGFVGTSILRARHILSGIKMVIVRSGMTATGSATRPRVVTIQPDQDLKALLGF
ncbi:hypothetical protein TIFTF001_022913 [Ficus carica]|uniref:Uncharacterized protein n=1 Tax=Ficus carica TaxID=3494 RepID=A0AA88DFW1_FICCA|nr:hypothetical protein TIFTF001_022913 [Ficus carica]